MASHVPDDIIDGQRSTDGTKRKLNIGTPDANNRVEAVGAGTEWGYTAGISGHPGISIEAFAGRDVDPRAGKAGGDLALCSEPLKKSVQGSGQLPRLGWPQLDPSGELLNSFIDLHNLALSRVSAEERSHAGSGTTALAAALLVERHAG